MHIASPRSASQQYLVAVSACLLALAGVAATPVGADAVAPGSGCATSGPASGAYSTTVCLTAPGDAASVSGDITVSAAASTSGASAGVQKVVFYLDGEYVLTDFEAPYSFKLPTSHYVDGTRRLEVEARMRDGFVTQRASVDVTLGNGVTRTPVNIGSFTPPVVTAPAGRPVVVAAVGDGGGGETSGTEVSNVISSWNPNLFLYLGDVYEKGTLTEFGNWYDRDFGRLRAITAPVIGNHEYENHAAPGYFSYWDNVPSYYSFDAGGWRVIALNSTSELGQTGPGSPQYRWLLDDLDAHPAECTLVYMHHPLFNIGAEGSATRLDAMWRVWTEHGVDLVLAGHDHTYQRWVPLDAAGNPDPSGLTEIVAGTGGHSAQSFVRSDDRVAAALTGFGGLRLELNARGAAFRFESSAGRTLDSGSVPCRGTPPDTTAPTAPESPTATARSHSQIDLRWTGAVDDVGITGYDIYRDGTKVDGADPTATWSDTDVEAGATHEYEVRARDAAGNVSNASTPATATTPAVAVLFSTGFESGDLTAWTFSQNVAVQQADVFAGAWAARSTSTGTAKSYLYKTILPVRPSLYYQVRFKVVSQDPKTLDLLRFRTSSGGPLLSLYRNASGKLGYRNDVAGVSTTSTIAISTGVWHVVQVRLTVADTASRTQTMLDGLPVAALSKTESLGTAAIGRLELGESTTGGAYSVVFDDVFADPDANADSQAPSTPSNLHATATSGLTVKLTWTPATDDIGVSGYDVIRAGAVVATIAPGSTYTDSTVMSRASYDYQLRARDAAGNVSGTTDPVVIDTPEVFADDFESGDLSAWTSSSGLGVQQQASFSGSWGARATSSGAATSAYKQLPVALSDLYFSTRLKLVTPNAGQVNLLRLRTSSGAALFTVSVAKTGKLAARNDVAGVALSSPRSVAAGRWHVLQAHLRIDAAGSATEVWLDGTFVGELSGAGAYGSTPIGRIELGDSSSGRSYDVSYDSVDADTNFIVDTTPPTAPTALTATALSSGTVRLRWTAATDDRALVGYEVYRDGSLIDTIDALTSYTDETVEPSRSYAYDLRAIDAGENESPASDAATVTTPTADLSPPTAPTGLAASAAAPTRVQLSWSPATDDVGVDHYDIARDGAPLATVDDPTTTYADTTASPQTTYRYTVTALDAAGHGSPASDPAVVTTPRLLLFGDGFEAGSLSQWSTVSGLVAQQQQVFGGAWAARATSTGSPSYAYRNLATSHADLYYRVRFKLVDPLAGGQAYLLKLRTATGASIDGLYVSSLGTLAYRNDVVASSKSSSQTVTSGVWHELQIRTRIAGAASAVEVYYDGAQVSELTRIDSLGTTPIGRLQFGEVTSGRTYDIAFDDVALDTSFVAP
ncbi:MAG: large repetitive protein [Solirubrobacteraceae bacterium]|nr:large repetitive protein [Solirubrobacteraceae bacterium]